MIATDHTAALGPSEGSSSLRDRAFELRGA